MKDAVLGAKWSPSAGPTDHMVVPATGLPSPSVQVNAVPPHSCTSIPRCRLYQACSAGASLALQKMPPMPVTRFMEPPRWGGGEMKYVLCGQRGSSSPAAPASGGAPGRRQTLALALHALLAGNLTFAGGIEHSVANLDLTLSLVMADDQATWRDAGPSQLERMRRRAVGEQLFTAAKHDRHREDAHSVDQVIGEQRVDEFGTALGDEVRTVFLLQALHVGDVAQEHRARPARIDLA